MNIKPNFVALGREYGCDYRTVKARYYKKLDKKWHRNKKRKKAYY